jgi:hypothetical protein
VGSVLPGTGPMSGQSSYWEKFFVHQLEEVL